MCHGRRIAPFIQGRFSADDNFLILDRARYKADPQERGCESVCACDAAQLSMLSIRLSPPLCPGVVLESLEPEFRRFHAGRSELHAKKGAGVLFERTFFVAGSVELGACVFEKQRLCAFDRSITEIRLIKPSIIMILPSKCLDFAPRGSRAGRVWCGLL